MHYTHTKGKSLSLSAAITAGLEISSKLKQDPLLVLSLVAHAHNIGSYRELIKKSDEDTDYATLGLGYLQKEYRKSYKKISKLAESSFFLDQDWDLRPGSLIQKLIDKEIEGIPLETINDLYWRLFEGSKYPKNNYFEAGYHAENNILALINFKDDRGFTRGSGGIHLHDQYFGVTGYLRYERKKDEGLKITVKELDPACYLEDKINSRQIPKEKFIDYCRAYIDYQSRVVKVSNPNHEIELIKCCNTTVSG